MTETLIGEVHLNKQTEFSVMIAGGGTGGHVYPGVAIAKEIQKLYPNVQIHFVGTKDGLETKIIPKEGFRLHLIQGGKLNFAGQPLKKLMTLIKLPFGFLQSVVLILKYRPQFVLGVGGYASGPFLLIASLMGRKTAIWEGNAIPGMTNRILGKFSSQIFTVFEKTQSHFQKLNVLALGLPLRPEIEEAAQRLQKLDATQFTVLHFGGSQGSRIIGTVFAEMIQKHYANQKNIRFIHQTGSVDYKKFVALYDSQGLSKEKGGNVEVKEFIYNMPDYYVTSDVVVARAGASTVAELSAFGIPTIFVPLPIADGHQEHNALSFSDAGGAICLLQKDLTAENLYQKIEELRSSVEFRQQLSEVMRRFYRPQAAKKIAETFIHS